MTELSKTPGHLIRRFQQIAVAIFHAEAGAMGHALTPVQYAALVTVQRHGGIDQATLAGLIAYDRTTIGGVVDRLVQKGCLERSVSDRDRRSRELRVTEEGLKVIAAIQPAVDAAQVKMLQGLSTEEAGELLRLLRKAIDAVNDRSRAPFREG